jgi:hypothetical protein
LLCGVKVLNPAAAASHTNRKESTQPICAANAGDPEKLWTAHGIPPPLREAMAPALTVNPGRVTGSRVYLKSAFNEGAGQP